MATTVTKDVEASVAQVWQLFLDKLLSLQYISSCNNCRYFFNALFFNLNHWRWSRLLTRELTSCVSPYKEGKKTSEDSIDLHFVIFSHLYDLVPYSATVVSHLKLDYRNRYSNHNNNANDELEVILFLSPFQIWSWRVHEDQRIFVGKGVSRPICSAGSLAHMLYLLSVAEVRVTLGLHVCPVFADNPCCYYSTELCTALCILESPLLYSTMLFLDTARTWCNYHLD